MKTIGELNYLAQKFAWKAGPLTRRQINQMTADESDWQSRVNGEEYARAWNEPQVKAENRKNLESRKSQRMWQEQNATEEEMQAAERDVYLFRERYPQFRSDFVPNREALISWMREKNVPCTFANLVRAFEDLASKGQLVLDPHAIGVGTEEEISGARLSRHPQLWKLLEPAPTTVQKEKLEVAKMSAEEYRKQHPEAFRQGTSALAQQKVAQGTATFLSFHPEYVLSDENKKHLRAYIEKRNLPYTPQSFEQAYAELVKEGYIETNPEVVVSSGATKIVDYGGQPKTLNLPREISRMTANEYQQWLQNPDNRRLVDAAAAR